MEYVPGFSLTSGETALDTIFQFYVISTSRWQMPLLFFISGMSSWIALGYKSAGSYSLERIKRLFIPLLFFMLFLYQPLAFFWPGTTDDRSISYYLLEFWPESLTTIMYNEYTGGPGWAHMWFVAYLLIFSFVMLPWFRKFRFRSFADLSNGSNQQKTSIGFVLLLGIPFILILISLEPLFPGHRNNLYTDWSYFTYNLASFVLGFVLCINRIFWNTVEKHAWWFFIFGLLAVIIQTIIIIRMPALTNPSYDPGFMIYTVFWGFNTWFCIIALLGLARKYINLNNRFLRYFSPASYPVYILHLVIMVVIASFMRPWQQGTLSEFVLLSVLSFAGTMLLYELLKRTRITRISMGIKC